MTHSAATVPTISTLGELKSGGYVSKTIREEMRSNLISAMRRGESLFPRIHGYENSVIPAIENAILSGQDIIFLGERGQAKTRLARSLVNLLDPWMPIVAGSEINDDPFNPISKYARDLVAERGDEAPISWVPREDRFGEKLATPDTTIADLIGEVDPIKVAEGRYLTDELTISYGLIPRTNRGIFNLNELPDLAERIQVGLLNILEERDVQIRGYKIRLPLDVYVVASANPEDYTNRGRIITPLKDRFGSQVRTHYPLDVETEVAIVAQEAQPFEADGITVRVPPHMAEIIATLSQLARNSAHISQRSGVSVRLSVSNHEVMVANAARRALATGDDEVVPRICDLEALPASTAGKVEIETLEDGREGQILDHLVRAAILETFRECVTPQQLTAVVEALAESDPVETGEDIASGDYTDLLEATPALRAPVAELVGAEPTPGEVASAIELVLEGLHLSKRLNKDAVGGRAQYRSR